MTSTESEAVPPWGPRRGPLRFQLGLATFGLLSLELALIRWTGGQIRIIAYFANLVLITAFLGMGLGVALGRRRPELVHRVLPVLAVVSVVLCFSGPLGLMHMRFPDPTISLWGGEALPTLWEFITSTLAVMFCFALIVSVFVMAGAPVGWLFAQLPPLTAYSADLAGSLLGVLATSAAAALGTPPAVWLILGVLPYVWLSRRPSTVAWAALVLILAMASAQDARFSPYNRIDLSRMADLGPTGWKVSVNRDFHQYILDLSDQRMSSEPPESRARLQREVYELPFVVKGGGGRALVVGAGTGNDVAAALRQGFQQVVSVEIDPALVALGRELHPEHPYQSPAVTPVVDDARAYYAQHPDERFDVVCYGLLDSHAMFSAMSTLRLDNYVYTLEGLQQGWKHVREGGLLSVSFSILAGNWVAARMRALLREATGLEPVIVPHDYNQGATFLVSRHVDTSRIAPDLYRADIHFDSFPDIRIPTDDWPYLYLRPGTFPWAYVTVLTLVLLFAAWAVRRVYGAEVFTAGAFDLPLFLMGAAFMLLETRLVTELSLLFGSTWVVNSAVFGGVLAMVLVANVWVSRRTLANPAVAYLLLLLSLAATTLLDVSRLSALPLVARAVVSGLVFALPVAFAGIIFSSRLRRAANPAAALGANLMGAVLGGCLEYSSMYLGLRSMGWLALAFYALSFVLARRETSTQRAPALAA